MNITARNYPQAGAYVRFWKRLKAAPLDQELTPNLAWDYGQTVRDALRKTHDAVNNRINSRGGLDVARGKKDNEFYRSLERRDAWNIHDRIIHRVRIYQFETKIARERFNHLLSDRNEE
jgi:hypothetical protein